MIQGYNIRIIVHTLTMKIRRLISKILKRNQKKNIRTVHVHFDQCDSPIITKSHRTILEIANENDIDNLYGKKFRLLSKLHNVQKEWLAEDDIRAMWQVICEKPFNN